MIILGIDPGMARLGWAILENQKSNIKSIDFGCIETDAGGKIENRLLTIEKEIEKIIQNYKPDVLAIEDLFFGANSKTALIVGQARGVALLSAGKANLPVSVYTPLEVKMALTGYGRADKNQIKHMVKAILKLENLPKLDDTTDALAIALTHIFSQKLKKLTASR